MWVEERGIVKDEFEIGMEGTSNDGIAVDRGWIGVFPPFQFLIHGRDIHRKLHDISILRYPQRKGVDRVPKIIENGHTPNICHELQQGYRSLLCRRYIGATNSYTLSSYSSSTRCCCCVSAA